MKALVKNNEIVQVSEDIFPVHPDYQWIDCPNDCSKEWIYKNGALEAPPVVIKTNQEMQSELLPSSHSMINAIWTFLMKGDRTDMNILDDKIEMIKKNFPIDN